MAGDFCFEHGANSAPYLCWRSVIGDLDTEKDAIDGIDGIDAVSLARRLASDKTPVLLVHGPDDTTGPSDQSDKMVVGNDRNVTLTALGDFLAKYLKPASSTFRRPSFRPWVQTANRRSGSSPPYRATARWDGNARHRPRPDDRILSRTS